MTIPISTTRTRLRGPRARTARWLLLAVLTGVGSLACGGGGEEPETAASVASLPTATSAPEAPAPTPPPSRPPETEPRDKPKTTYVIEEHEDSVRPNLAEAARRAREGQAAAPEARIRITDENLAEYATGQVTLAHPDTAEPETTPADSADEAGEVDDGGIDPTGSDPRDEDYWRRGARELRLQLRRAWEDARELEKQAAGLRIRFYAEDDPYVRDSEVKPAWDRALEARRQALQETRAYRRELEEFLQEGHRAGALPGWLREGMEYEPDLSELDAQEEGENPEAFTTHEPRDPEPMARPPRDPGGGGESEDRP